MRSHAVYAPDGMGMGRGELRTVPAETSDAGLDPVGRMMLEAVLPHERHDDGLVHSHGWAVSPTGGATPRESGSYFCPHFSTRSDRADANAMETAARGAPLGAAAVTECYDDGLVHNHHWAATKL
jgi:hypothetical protein